MNNILVFGNCGVGKTWAVTSFAKGFSMEEKRLGLFTFLEGEGVIVIGKYADSPFPGSDMLSMGLMKDVDAFLSYSEGSFVVGEGDRLMNKTWVSKANPIKILISGSGDAGRLLRGVEQSPRHLKAIGTRVRSIVPDIISNNSVECLSQLRFLYSSYKQSQ